MLRGKFYRRGLCKLRSDVRSSLQFTSRVYLTSILTTCHNKTPQVNSNLRYLSSSSSSSSAQVPQDQPYINHPPSLFILLHKPRGLIVAKSDAKQPNSTIFSCLPGWVLAEGYLPIGLST